MRLPTTGDHRIACDLSRRAVDHGDLFFQELSSSLGSLSFQGGVSPSGRDYESTVEQEL